MLLYQRFEVYVDTFFLKLYIINTKGRSGMKYLSDYITTKNLNEWINEYNDLLIVANAGAGKTYLLLKQFVNEAKKRGLNVLYCYNRKLSIT